jgi:chromosome segregation ATPase
MLNGLLYTLPGGSKFTWPDFYSKHDRCPPSTEMSIDRVEAFRHNACKKVAQLCKVVVEMTDEQLDRQDDSRRVARGWERQIDAAFSKNTRDVSDINQSVIMFRQHLIDQHCQEFGPRYQALKEDLADFERKQKSRVTDLGKTITELRDQILSIENDVQKAATKVVNAADSVMKIRSANPSSIRSEAGGAVKNVDNKIEQLLADHEIRIRNANNEHSKTKQKLKAEISRLFQGLISQKRGDISKFSSRLNTVKAQVMSYRKEYAKIVKEHENSAKSLKEAISKCRGLGNRRSSDRKRAELEAQLKKESKEKAAEISEFWARLEEAKAGHKALLERYQKHIDDKLRKMEELNLNRQLRENEEEESENVGEDLDGIIEKRKVAVTELLKRIESFGGTCEAECNELLDKVKKRCDLIAMRFVHYAEAQGHLWKAEQEALVRRGSIDFSVARALSISEMISPGMSSKGTKDYELTVQKVKNEEKVMIKALDEEFNESTAVRNVRPATKFAFHCTGARYG